MKVTTLELGNIVKFSELIDGEIFCVRDELAQFGITDAPVYMLCSSVVSREKAIVILRSNEEIDAFAGDLSYPDPYDDWTVQKIDTIRFSNKE